MRKLRQGEVADLTDAELMRAEYRIAVDASDDALEDHRDAEALADAIWVRAEELGVEL